MAATTTTLPEEFHTVVLGSYDDRANADARLREVRNQGSRTPACSTRRSTTSAPGGRSTAASSRPEQAEAHRQELSGLGVTPSFYKHVTRSD